VFQGVDSLVLDSSSCTFFINRDKTGFYVFSMRDGLTPEVKWVRGVRDMDPRNFEARYAALVNCVGDRVNGYKIESAKFGTNLQACKSIV
jgi:hypothetical protein